MPARLAGEALVDALVVGSAEFAGPFEETGWNLAGTVVPITYGPWSLWLVAAGAALLIGEGGVSPAVRRAAAERIRETGNNADSPPSQSRIKQLD